MAHNVTIARDIPEELAERLFEAAFACFGERGFDRTTMEDIAARAGVARATLYYHFRGKDELFLFLLQRGVGTLRTALDEAVALGGSGRERLERALDRLVELFVEHRHVCLVVFQQLGRLEQQWRAFPEWLRGESEFVLRDILLAGARDGTLREVDAETIAPAIFGAALWAVLHHVIFSEDVPVGRVEEQVRALVVEGLAGV